MIRFCPILAAGLGISLGNSGCTGQSITGRWKGALPYNEASDCRIRLYDTGKFDFICKGDAWSGLGKYEYSGDSLSLNYDILARRGKVIERAERLHYSVEGHGNRIVLSDHFGTRVEWERVLGGE